MKMEKTPRYTQRERNMVLGFAAQYKDVIENKRTDAESNRKKDEVWRQIAKEFNCRVYHQRSSKQLRQLYKNMKLLLKKDLCGAVGGGGGGAAGAAGGGGPASGSANAPVENKGQRSFMDILNALSQQDSVAQYISGRISPSAYSNSRQQKFDDDFDDSKLPSVTYDGLENDVIVIKSEDISDNEQSSQNGAAGCVDDMDEDDDDCLSPKDIPEVCLEEEDEEIFATDLRQPAVAQQSQQQSQQQQQQQQCLQMQLAQQQLTQQQQPEITIQNVGGIRVGSIGSMANIVNATKALLNGTNSSSGGGNTGNTGNTGTTNASNSINNRSSANASLTTTTTASNSRAIMSVEQLQREQQQQLLFSGLGLSAVHVGDQQHQQHRQQTQFSALQNATQRTSAQNYNSHSINHSINHNSHSSLLGSMNNGAVSNTHNKGSNSNHGHHNHHHHHGGSSNGGIGNKAGGSSSSNDYLMSLAIEERRRKIDLLNAQIEYWKTLTRKLDANSGHSPNPSCLCHFPPAKLNGLQTQQSSS